MDQTPETPTPDETNLLDDVQYTLYQAGPWKRFANYLTDRIAFYFLWMAITNFLAYPVVRFLYKIFHDTTLIVWLWFFISVLTFVLIIAGLETATGGKTLGKLFTSTRAVNDDGTRISGRTALLRALSRLVPFEAFSALGTPSYPWHDRWTKTIVIDEKETTLPPWD